MKKINLYLIFGAIFLPTRVFAQQIFGGFINSQELFQTEDLMGFANNLINLLFLIALIVAAVYALIAAYNYFFANGNMEKVMQGRNLFLSVVIGIVLTIAFYAIFKFILSRIA